MQHFIEDKLIEVLILLPALLVMFLDRWMPKHISENRLAENAIIIGAVVAWFLFAVGPGRRIIRWLLRGLNK